MFFTTRLAGSLLVSLKLNSAFIAGARLTHFPVAIRPCWAWYFTAHSAPFTKASLPFFERLATFLTDHTCFLATMSIRSPQVFAIHFDSLFLNNSHDPLRPFLSQRPIRYSPANQSPSDSEHSHFTPPTVRVFVAVVIVFFLAGVCVAFDWLKYYILRHLCLDTITRFRKDFQEGEEVCSTPVFRPARC